MICMIILGMANPPRVDATRYYNFCHERDPPNLHQELRRLVEEASKNVAYLEHQRDAIESELAVARATLARVKAALDGLR